MEINKLCKKLDNLPNNLKKSCIKDITNILDMMFEEYDIFYKDTSESVKKQIIINKFTSIFSEQEEQELCRGFSQNGNKCFKKTHQDSDFCKIHGYLAFRQKSNVVSIKTEGNLFDTSIQEIISKPQKDLDILSLKEKFINDSFYYYDDRFIYDKSSLEKVGYLAKPIDSSSVPLTQSVLAGKVKYLENDDNQNFILTDDPFILETL